MDNENSPLPSDSAGKAQVQELIAQKSKMESALLEFALISEHKEEHRATLDEIARSGMQVLRADAAGVFVVDHDAGEFVFETIIGGGGPELVAKRMPLTAGIPGLVAATGQPEIILHADRDSRVAELNTGYRPRSILCVPMFHESRIIGVLGFYDKKGHKGEHDENGFSHEDVSTATAFSSIASRVLRHSQSRLNLKRALDEHEQSGELTDSVQRTEKLADLIKDLAFSGEREMQLTISILTAIRDYIGEGDRR